MMRHHPPRNPSMKVVSPTNIIDLTTSTRPPEQHTSVPPSTLARISDKRIVLTEAYLNGRIIKNSLTIILASTPRIDFLNSYFLEYASDPTTSTLSLAPWHRKLTTYPDRTWYVPVCHRRIHWIFLKINPSNHTIEQYDSLISLQTPDYTHYLKPILEEGDEQPWRTTYPTTQQQQNGYDCGLHVLAEIHRQVYLQTLPPASFPHRNAILQTLTGTLPATYYQGARKIRPGNTPDKPNCGSFTTTNADSTHQTARTTPHGQHGTSQIPETAPDPDFGMTYEPEQEDEDRLTPKQKKSTPWGTPEAM